MTEFLAALPRRTDPAIPPPLRVPAALIDIPIDQLVLPILHPPPPPPTPQSVREHKRHMSRMAVEGPLPADQAMYTHLPLARSRHETSRLRRELEERVESLRAYIADLSARYGVEQPPGGFEQPGRRFWEKWISMRAKLREALLASTLSLSSSEAEMERTRIDLAWPAFPVTDLCGDLGFLSEPMRLCEDLRTPKDMEILNQLQCEMLPKWHFWGLGLRDVVMVDMLRGFCNKLRAAGGKLGSEGGGEMSSRLDGERQRVIAVVGKAHCWGIRRLWKEKVVGGGTGEHDPVILKHMDSAVAKGRFLFSSTRPAGIPEPDLAPERPPKNESDQAYAQQMY